MVRLIMILVLLAFSPNACKNSDAGGPPRVGAGDVNTGAPTEPRSPEAQVTAPPEDKARMIQGKPVFDLRLDIERCPHEVYVNGGLVERNFEPTPAHVEHQINHYLRSGPNDIEVQMIRFDDDPSECDVRVQLRYTDLSAPDDATPITLLSLTHDAKAPPADLARGSSQSGAYDSKTGMPRDGGDVRVDAASIVTLTDQIQVLSQRVDLSLPFPEWAFLRSEQMTLDWQLTEEAETRAYEELLARYNELHALLQKQDIEAFLDACEERSRELDLAYYKAPGATRRALEQNLRQAMADPTLELADLYKAPGKRWGYMVGSKGTLAALTQGKRASPIFRYQMKDDTPFSMVFPVLFRKEKGKLIVTR